MKNAFARASCAVGRFAGSNSSIERMRASNDFCVSKLGQYRKTHQLGIELLRQRSSLRFPDLLVVVLIHVGRVGGRHYLLYWDRFLREAYIVLVYIVILQHLVEPRPSARSWGTDEEEDPHQLVRIGFTHNEHLLGVHFGQDTSADGHV
jgi:hypothetical protein